MLNSSKKRERWSAGLTLNRECHVPADSCDDNRWEEVDVASVQSMPDS
jgi:hypothetical protein